MPNCRYCATYPPGVLCETHYWEGARSDDVHPAVLEARELLLLEERQRAAMEYDGLNRMWRCLVLAPTLEVFLSLLRGEKVPEERLDPLWLRRFRRKDAA